MPFVRFLLAAALLIAQAPAFGQARDSVAGGPALSLDDAQALASRNNPDYLQTRNNRGPANAAVRSAYGAFLPSLTGSLSAQWQQGGQQFFNGSALGASSDVLQSSYDLGLGYELNASKFIAPRAERARRDAVEADIAGAAATLRGQVAQQYLTALQSAARATLQDTLLGTARQQVDLARARAAVGAGTQLDVRRAEVALGQQQVQAIQAHNQAEVDKLRLFQQLAVPQPANVRLTSAFPVARPTLVLDDVLSLARRQNPQLGALRSRERAASLGVSEARTQYTPTLRVSTGVGGYTYQYSDRNFPARQALLGKQQSCLQTENIKAIAGQPSDPSVCSALTLTPGELSAARSGTDVFPFNFTNAPRQVTATLSIPIFDNFAREQRVEEAQATRADARYLARSRELALTADVTSAYRVLDASYQTVQIQEQNAAKAREELTLAEERYKVGLATFLDVTQARDAFERAENDRITAIYDYHKAFAALESAVGRPLR